VAMPKVSRETVFSPVWITSKTEKKANTS
jgi:hypothetical protein